MDFHKKLLTSASQSGSVLCVGLDPDPQRFPAAIARTEDSDEQKTLQFCRDVVRLTRDMAAAYKLNIAFFEALGASAYHVVDRVLQTIPEEKIVIADVKRGDVPHTAERFSSAYFDRFGFDAVTLSPLMGFETLKPFLSNREKGVYVLALTSNPGADDFLLKPFADRPTMAIHIAGTLQSMARTSAADIGMVIGATRDQDAEAVIRSFPHAPLLIPGIGSQGGSVDRLIHLLRNHRGMPLINVGRAILYPWEKTPPPVSSSHEWGKDVQQAAIHYHQLLKPVLQHHVQT